MNFRSNGCSDWLEIETLVELNVIVLDKKVQWNPLIALTVNALIR